MRKKLAMLLFISAAMLNGSSCSQETHPNTVNWFYEGDFITEKGEKAFNELLQSKGHDIYVDFQGVWMSENYFETGVMPEFEDADILSLPVELPYTCHYAEMARNGELYNWTNYLESPEGKKLKDSMPQLTWDSMCVDGEIFGLLNPDVYVKQYIVMNRDMMDKYGMNVPEKLSFNQFLDILEIVWEGEKERGLPIFQNTYLRYLPTTYTIMYGGYETIGIYQNNGEWTADLLIDIPEYMEYLTIMTELCQEGVLGYDQEAMAAGQFLGYTVSTYSAEAALQSAQEIYDGNYVVIECEDWNGQITGSGYKTVIMSDTNQIELAKEVLTAVYTDQELSEFLAYSSGDVPAEVLNGKISTIQNNSSTHGNLFLLRPALTRTEGWQEEIRAVFNETNKSELCGFYADLRDFQEQWREIVLIQTKHMDFYCGMSENIVDEAIKIRLELKRAGIDDVLEKLTAQVKDFLQGRNK